jgi:predicted TIM-barrel fold metal-dependent hydrolase
MTDELEQTTNPHNMAEARPIAGIVDSHHHLWDLARLPYPWLRPEAPPRPFGDHSPIKRDYLPGDYRRDTRGIGIAASVHVEAASGATDPAAETAWLEDLRVSQGIPDASIAHFDPSSPSVARDLDAILSHPGARGVRTGIAWRANSPWKFAPGPEVTRASGFREGVAEIARRGCILELILLPEQLPEIADLAAKFPNLTIVLNHLATLQPEIPGVLDVWEVGMRRIAGHQNVFVKLSGLWTIARDWNMQRLRDPVRLVVEAFGPDRCMWGSNLPIEGLMCPATRQVEILSGILADIPLTGRAAVFGGTAARVYRLADIRNGRHSPE